MPGEEKDAATSVLVLPVVESDSVSAVSAVSVVAVDGVDVG